MQAVANGDALGAAVGATVGDGHVLGARAAGDGAAGARHGDAVSRRPTRSADRTVALVPAPDGTQVVPTAGPGRRAVAPAAAVVGRRPRLLRRARHPPAMTALLAGLVVRPRRQRPLRRDVRPARAAGQPEAVARRRWPRRGRRRRRRWPLHAALYHGGRAMTYLGLGALAGLAGSAMARLGSRTRAGDPRRARRCCCRPWPPRGLVRGEARVARRRARRDAGPRSRRRLDAHAPRAGPARCSARSMACCRAACSTPRSRPRPVSATCGEALAVHGRVRAGHDAGPGGCSALAGGAARARVPLIDPSRRAGGARDRRRAAHRAGHPCPARRSRRDARPVPAPRPRHDGREDRRALRPAPRPRRTGRTGARTIGTPAMRRRVRGRSGRCDRRASSA